MNPLDNLKSYKPGQSGNPAGKPKGLKHRATIMREILALLEPDGSTKEYHMNHAIIRKAMEGDVGAFKELQDSLYGKVPDKLLHAETDEEKIERDITDEVLKLLPQEELEAILAKKDD